MKSQIWFCLFNFSLIKQSLAYLKKNIYFKRFFSMGFEYKLKLYIKANHRSDFKLKKKSLTVTKRKSEPVKQNIHWFLDSLILCYLKNHLDDSFREKEFLRFLFYFNERTARVDVFVHILIEKKTEKLLDSFVHMTHLNKIP